MSVLRSVRVLLAPIVEASLAIFKSRHTLIMFSTIVLLMLWGTHGKIELLHLLLPGWTGPASTFADGRASLIPGLPWDQEWISFAIGALALIGVPCLIIRFSFRERVRDYGLGGPRAGQWRETLWSTLLLAVIGFPSMLFASRDPSMRALYPLFHHFRSFGSFAAYEVGYFAFFLVIEFVFRGYLLLGLYGAHHPGGMDAFRRSQDPPLLNHYSIVVSMLSYTAWHLGKPLEELWGTLLWGVVTGAVVLRSGTIWPVVLIHWSMNVFLDYLIWTS